MVLNNELLKRIPHEFKENFKDYTLLRTSHFPYGATEEIFREAIQVLNLCHCMRLVNKFLTQSKLSEPIDYSILYVVLQNIEEDKALTDEQLKEYMVFYQKMENFAEGLGSITTGLPEVMYIESSTELSMIGFDKKKQSKLRRLNDDIYGHALDKFHVIAGEALKGKFPLDKFRSKALDFMEGEMKKAEAGRK